MLDMTARVPLATGISEFINDYDAVIVDLWGVIHDGVTPYPGVADCLQRLADEGKPYAMLSNAPRRAAAIATGMEGMGLPAALYPHIMSSGEATWLGLKERRETWFDGVGMRCLHIGPARDESLFEETGLERVGSVAEADFIVNTGPWEDGETVADYDDRLIAGAARGLKMVCANPDLEVIRGGRRIICAGALARRYEELGGDVLYYGKPYRPIYDSCLHMLGDPDPGRTLAIGDSLRTDIAGAAGAGMDSILVVGGLHGEEFTAGQAADKAVVEARITELCAREGHFPIAAIPRFTW
jgi:HAD superfamily hydrolase (TIGR01459 family)